MGPPHPILEHVLREMQRRKVRAKGPWHLGATAPQIERGDAPAIAAFLLERSATTRAALHPQSRRLLDVLEGAPIREGERASLPNQIAVALGEAIRKPGALDDGLATARALVDLVTSTASWSRPLEAAAEITASHLGARGVDLAAFAREVDERLMLAELLGVLAKTGSALAPSRVLFRWAADVGHSCDWWVVTAGDAHAAVSRGGVVQQGSIDDALSTLPELAFESATRALSGSRTS